MRSTLPVLSNLLLETDKKYLRISATDLELAIATHVEAKIEQEGSFTVPAKLFQEFIHQAPESELEFQLLSNELICSGQNVKARIPGIESDEYPGLPNVEEEQILQLPAAALVEGLKQVVVACAQDQGRPVLTGVYCQLEKEQLTIAATDSFRLAERILPGVAINKPRTILIPNRTIQEVIRIAGQMESLTDISLTLSEQQIVLKLDNVELYSRLLVGNFPKYRTIIPQNFVVVAEVATDALTQALRLATVFAQGGVANTLLYINDDGLLEVSSYGTQRGGTNQKVPTKIVEQSGGLKAAFNSRFLLDALGAVAEPKVQLQFSGPTTPLVMTTGDPNYTQLVMPIRIEV